MSNVFVLKDPLYNEISSKINNFTLEWIKWFRFAKIAPKTYKFTCNDIIIINLNDGIDPCKGYNIHPGCKRIFIVHKINLVNIKYLKTANYIIYINDVMRQIAEIGGIFKPYTVCPRYPLYNFFNTQFNKVDMVHIGGWFFEDRIEGLREAFNDLDNKLPNNIKFTYNYVWGGIDSRKQQLIRFIDKIKVDGMMNHRANIFPVIEHPYSINLFNTRISKYGFIYRNSPSIEKVFDLINDKDESILNYDISESSMLSMYQSSNTEIICNNTIECLPYFNPTSGFTFKNFSDLITTIIKKLS